MVCQCRDFIRDGAERGNTPSEVVQACDITLSCVSDPTALKDVCYHFTVFVVSHLLPSVYVYKHIIGSIIPPTEDFECDTGRFSVVLLACTVYSQKL